MIATEELVKRVRVLVNEVGDDVSVSLLSDDARSFDKSIETLLPQAVSLVQKNKAQGKRVNARCVSPGNAEFHDNGDDSGYMAVPRDFVSVLSLKLDCWERECTILYPVISRQAACQASPHIRAGACRPVCVEGTDSAGNRVVNLYPFKGEAVLERFVYEASFDAKAGLDGYDSGMDDAVAYQCAALLYNMFEKYDAASAFLSHALALCNGSITINK